MATPEDPNHNPAADLFEQTVRNTLAHLDKITAQAKETHEAALDELAAAREERRRIEADAKKITEAYFEEHRKEMEKKMRQEALECAIKNMLRAGQTDQDIQEWLEVPFDMVEHARAMLKFRSFGREYAMVEYQQEGRSGYVIFRKGKVELRFYYEFGGGNTLALVTVPDEDHWEKETRQPLETRKPILEFIGNRIIEDQTPGHKFQLSGDTLRIYKP